jgi:hypothetical protein
MQIIKHYIIKWILIILIQDVPLEMILEDIETFWVVDFDGDGNDILFDLTGYIHAWKIK